MDVDRRIASVAGSQHGVMTTAQLVYVGLSRPAIAKRVASGRLHPMHRGVYAVGHRGLSREGRWMAAVLARGGGAFLSHGSAAELWGLVRNGGPRTHVTTPNRRRSLDRIESHVARALIPGGLTRRFGIPVSSATLAIVDLSAVWNPYRLANAMHEADYLGRLDLDSVRSLLASGRAFHGRPVLRQAFEHHVGGSAGTRSHLEQQVIAAIDQLGLPEPLVNTPVATGLGPIEVDLSWEAWRLCVEVDGVGHRRARSRAADLRRDGALNAAGWEVLRIDGPSFESDPEQALDPVRRALGEPRRTRRHRQPTSASSAGDRFHEPPPRRMVT